MPQPTLPQNVQLVAPRDELDFLDSQTLTLPKACTPLEAWHFIMQQPIPLMKLAFSIRDAISSRFGVKRIGGFSGKRDPDLTEGDHLDFFLIERLTPDILTLTERDTHLDVMTCITRTGQTLTITSSVITHNRFGRAYMVPVRPAHRLLVKIMMKRLARHLAQN